MRALRGLAALLCPAVAAAAAPPVPTPAPAVPTVLLKNAAKPGVRYPLIGLGTRGAGYEIGQKEECWHYPSCCTKDYCPSINATRDWLKMGGVRIDTGYPFGDTPGTPGNPGKTCTPSSGPGTTKGGHWCDAHGIAKGIKDSGVKREDMFITVKSGTAGPMQNVKLQGGGELDWLGLEYADLYLMHEGDLGTPGHKPDKECQYPTSDTCRIDIFKSCIQWMKNGKTRACGVANWRVEWLEALAKKVSSDELPAVVQWKFHPHQSLQFDAIKAIKDFCDKHDIVFNGYSPLGRADWTTFNASVGTPTLLQEPAVKDIAARVGKSTAQVLLRWNIQQNIPTQARTIDPAHMAENMDIFNWQLADADMQTLSSMPQCCTHDDGTFKSCIRGNPYMDGDPEKEEVPKHPPGYHDNMIGPTRYC